MAHWPAKIRNWLAKRLKHMALVANEEHYLQEVTAEEPG